MSAARSPDWTLTSLEAAALEDLADLQKSDPARYAEILSERSEQEQQEEHGTALLSTLENASTLRQEQDHALLSAIFRGSASEASEAKAGEAKASEPDES